MRNVWFYSYCYCIVIPYEKKDNSSVSNHNSETAYCNTIHCVYETYKSLKIILFTNFKKIQLIQLGHTIFIFIKIILIYLHRIW